MDDTFVIREANNADSSSLSALAIRTYRDAFGDTMSEADLTAHLNKHLAPEKIARIIEQDVVLVAVIGERLVGYVQFGALSADASDTQAQELRRLYVEREFQNRGYGKALMDAALHHPVLENAANIYLDVWEHNHGAQRLYQSYGFEVIGRRHFEVESGAETSDDLIMVRQS